MPDLQPLPIGWFVQPVVQWKQEQQQQQEEESSGNVPTLVHIMSWMCCVERVLCAVDEQTGILQAGCVALMSLSPKVLSALMQVFIFEGQKEGSSGRLSQ